MIDIVCSHDRPDKLLKEIVLFVGAFGGRNGSKLVSFVMEEGAGHILDRLVPVYLNKVSFPLDKGRCDGFAWRSCFINAVRDPLKGVVCAHKRGRQPMRAMNKFIAKASSNTKFSPVCRVFRIASGLNNGVSTHTQIESAAHTAISAGGLHLPGWVFDFFGYQGRSRTTLNAFAARRADRFLEWLVTKGAHLKFIAPISHINGINAHDFATGSNTYAAVDALIGIEIKKGIAGINRKVFGYTVQAIEPSLIKTDAVDQFLEAASPAFRTKQTVEIMVAQNEFKGHTANLLNFRVIRDNRHPLFNRGAAGRMELFLLLNLNEAYPAYPFRRDVRAMAQSRNVYTSLFSCFQDGSAFCGLYLEAVYG